MRLHHLKEATNTSALTATWEGPAVHSIAKMLQSAGEEGGNTPEQMLGSMLEKAVQKHAKSDPVKLFSMLPAIIRAKQHPEFQGWSGHAYHGAVQALVIACAEGAAKSGDAAVKQLLDKVPYKQLVELVPPKLAVKMKLLADKFNRTPEEEDHDNEQDLFVFIGRPAFKEVPEGSGNFRKTIDVENMVKVDRFDADAHAMVGMMKLRARFQGENSEVYMLHLPAGTFKGGRPDDWLLDIIDKHKRPITN